MSGNCASRFRRYFTTTIWIAVPIAADTVIRQKVTKMMRKSRFANVWRSPWRKWPKLASGSRSRPSSRTVSARDQRRARRPRAPSSSPMCAKPSRGLAAPVDEHQRHRRPGDAAQQAEQRPHLHHGGALVIVARQLGAPGEIRNR